MSVLSLTGALERGWTAAAFCSFSPVNLTNLESDFWSRGLIAPCAAGPGSAEAPCCACSEHRGVGTRCWAVPPAWPSSLPPWVNARSLCSTAAPTLRRVWEPGCFTAKSPVWLVDKGRFIALTSALLSLWCLFNALCVLLVYCICRAAITAPTARTLCCICVRYLVKEEKERGRGSLRLEKTESNLCARCVLAASWMGYVARNYIASVIIVIKCSKCALVFKVNW